MAVKMAAWEEEEVLVEERDEGMVSSLTSQKHVNRKAWFLKPTSRITTSGSSNHPFAPSHYKPISLSPSEAPSILFRGWHCPQRQWSRWVHKLEPIYKELWQKVGIFEAIKASTYTIRKDPSSVLGAAGFWCEETNTFIFPWGEATITLEDVMVLGGFSVLGEPIRVAKPLEDELGELESRMNRERREFNRSRSKKCTHSEWISHYIESEGGEIELIAFLALWLTRFVFPARPYKTVGQHVIPIAIRLARGVRVALAPAVLASLYHDLRAMKDHLTSRQDSELSVWAPLQILQLWVWERFLVLRPKSQNFVDSHEPRAARWHDVGKTLDFSFVMSVIKSPHEFLWQPYMTSLDNWRNPSFYRDKGEWFYGSVLRKNEELGLFACCLRASELVGLDCIEQYLPHRVALQFGLDQDIPYHVPRANSVWEVAWETYDIGTKNVLFYVTPRLFESDFSLQYSIWWKRVEEFFRKKIEGRKRKETLHVPHRKKRKLWDLYNRPAPDNHSSSSKSTCEKSREDHTGAQNTTIHRALNCSEKHSERMDQNADAVRETHMEKRAQSGKVVASNALDIDKGTSGDAKNKLGESAYDPVIDLEVVDLEVVEVPEAKSKEETEPTKIRNEKLERGLDIKRRKEEIKLLEARIRELESMVKVHS